MTGRDCTIDPGRSRRRAAAGALLLAAALPLAACIGGDRHGAGVNVFARYERARALRPNPDLWVAANAQLAFARKKVSDPFGGVLATDWYRPKEAPGERRRVTVNILGAEAAARNLKIAIHRQVRRGGVWRNRPVDASTVAALHRRIVRAARQRADARNF